MRPDYSCFWIPVALRRLRRRKQLTRYASISPVTTPLPPLLSGVRILESSLLGPGLLGTFLSDLGAEVIKVESPKGDYIRQMTWPIVEGDSLLHLHTHRNKKSIVLDLKSDAGLEVFRELAATADGVIEAMRPGALSRLGIGWDELRTINPAIVFITISGYGATGPYATMPSHGIAYDTWAGQVIPAVDEDGFTRIPSGPNIGINVGPMIGALGLLAGIVNARATGEGSHMELAQSDAAAYAAWYEIETWRAYQRPDTEVTGNPSDDYERRAPGKAGMWDAVRYQIYEANDRQHVMLMASEQAFWKNFCEGVGRPELFEQNPGSTYADHARGNTELQRELKAIFASRSSEEWLAFSRDHNTPIAPVNTAETIADDPQFQHRMPWLPAAQLGADQLPLPIKVIDGASIPDYTRAPTVGQHTSDVMASVLGKDTAAIAALTDRGAFG